MASMWMKSGFSISVNCLEWMLPVFSGPNGNCVSWAKSARSNPSGNCVEAGHDDQDSSRVLLRDSKDPDGPVLEYGADYWRGGRAVHFTPVPAEQVPAHLVFVRDMRKEFTTDSWYKVSRGVSALYFDADEVRAFRDAVEADAWVPVAAS
jgi:Domain of unknown function (DUF397)